MSQFIFSQNGTCNNPSLIVQDVGTGDPGITFNQCVLSPIQNANQIIIFTEVTSSNDGTLGLIQQLQIGGACSNNNTNTILASRIGDLFPAGNCAGIPIPPTTANAGNSATFNPEWTGLTPNATFVIRITMTIPNACSFEIQEACLNQYSPALPAVAPACGTCLTPTCPIFNAPDFATSTATYPNSNMYDPSPDLVGPITFTNCYSVTTTDVGTLGFKQGVFQINLGCATKTYSLKSDCNQADILPTRLNTNGSASGFNPEWDNLPIGTYVLCITTTLADEFCDFDFSQTGFYVIPNAVPDCPSINSFISLDWNAANSFPIFSNTTLNCNDAAETIWVNTDETTWITGGELQASPGFVINLATNTNSPTRTSVLVNVDGQDFSFYGPVGGAPANTFDWGPTEANGMLIMEPYLTAGAQVTLTICDSRNAAQSFPYEIYDYVTGALLTSGTATPSNGNCITITFTLAVPPTMTWDIDGNQNLIVNNDNGSATFNPALMTEGNHTINYTYSNGSCNVDIAQNITILSTIIPTFDPISAICLNSPAPLLPTTSLNGITGTWDNAVTTNTLGTTTYNFTPDAGQCALNAALSVNIVNLITPTFDPIVDLCLNSVPPLLPGTSLNGISGIWDVSLTTNTSGTTTYNFIPDAGQCAASGILTVTIVDLTVPVFNTISDICLNAQAPLLPTTSVNGITGSWDNAIATNTAGPTTFNFTPDAGQCAGVGTLTVTIINPTEPTFTLVPAICSGANLANLPTNSNNNINGTWFPAINNVATTNYIFTPAAGQCANTASMTITVNQAITPTFNSVSPICVGETLNPLPTQSINNITGLWLPALNSNATTTYTFTPASGQCANTATLSIGVNSLQTPSFNTINPICIGDQVNTLPTSSTNNIQGAWTPAINNTVTTNYTFTPLAGECANSTTLTITVNQLITPTFTAIQPICAGETINDLPVNSNNNIAGTWSPAINNTATTNYTFTPANGQCATDKIMSIVVNAPITPSFAAITDLCVNSVAPILPPVSFNGINGVWNNAISTSTAGSTTYTFTPNIGECANVKTITINTIGNPIANASSDVTSGNSVLTVNFTNLSSNATNFTWNFGNNLSSNSSTTTSSIYSEIGDYFVTLKASNGVCPDAIWTSTITVIEDLPLEISVPNIFTPNNDGNNDEYFIQVYNAKSFEAEIYNRWGNSIHSLKTINEKWDGKDSTEGVYYIKYKVVGLNNEIKEGTTFFHLSY